MKRLLHKELVNWKNSPHRKPLVLEGARQVGKTWLLKEFAKTEYENYVYINCETENFIKEIFFDFDIPRILRAISSNTNKKILPQKTLIIFDEIQVVPNALTCLKYFCENANEYHVIVAGSLLGIQIHEGTGFPVGKVDRLTLYPLSFKEFLLAMGKDILVEYLDEHKWSEYSSLQSELTDLLRQYYFTGGMPLVVQSYAETKDILQVRKIQKTILRDYEEDFSKHIPRVELAKVFAVWNSIPSQLCKENKKFIWGVIKKGSRAKDFENAIQWLINAGLVHKVPRVKKIQMPLKFYEDNSAFKLFFNDVGLLAALADVPAKEIFVNSKMMSEYKGAFTEQYIAEQFLSSCSFSETKPLYYYSNENSTSEIDFVLQSDTVYPIEVKAEENLKAKSLSTVLKENDELKGIRFSMSNYREQEQMINVPLYLAYWYFDELML